MNSPVPSISDDIFNVDRKNTVLFTFYLMTVLNYQLVVCGCLGIGGNEKNTLSAGIPFHLLDYIELVDWTGRAVVPRKRGSIDSALPPVLQRLGLEPTDWITFATEIETQFSNWIGSPSHFAQTSSNVGQRWICSTSGSRQFY